MLLWRDRSTRLHWMTLNVMFRIGRVALSKSFLTVFIERIFFSAVYSKVGAAKIVLVFFEVIIN